MKRKIIFLLSAAMLLFIWGHSMVPERASAHESLWFLDTIVNPLLQRFGNLPIDMHTLRKITHVAEFCLLSIFTALYWRGKPVKNLYTGLTVALLDETIQVVTGRGALITDIWVDMIGVGVGTVIGCGIWKLKNGRHNL